MPTVRYGARDWEVPEVYQPVYGVDMASSRGCADRACTIIAAEYGYNGGRAFGGLVTDWGTNMGYIACALGACGGNVIGLDTDARYVALANAIAEDMGNVSFAMGDIQRGDHESATHVCLSVLHHVSPTYEIPAHILAMFKRGDTVYLELAHANESAHWAPKLTVPDKSRHIYAFLHDYLRDAFGPDWTVRLIGVHGTHVGGERPMYQCKRNVSVPLKVGKRTGRIVDTWTLPFMGWEGPDGAHGHDGTTYSRAVMDDGSVQHVKIVGERVTLTPWIDGYLLSDLLRFGMLARYDRARIREQLREYADGGAKHSDPHPWNYIVSADSTLHAIDDTRAGGQSILCKRCAPLSVYSIMALL